MNSPAGLTTFLAAWPADQAFLKDAFLKLRQQAAGLEGVEEEYISRPGVTDSLRFNVGKQHAPERTRPVFMLLDVVPFGEELMLSVCFYEEEVGDPDELGNGIPGGLMGEDGYCFDLEEEDPKLVSYLLARVREAHTAALGA